MKYYSVTGLANLLGLCERTVYCHARDGMPHLKVGRIYRFDLDKVLAWLESETSKAQEPK